MQQDLITILGSGVFATALCSGVTYLAKSLITERLKNAIQHEYEQKLETHKAQLKSENDKEIEELKARLAIASAERNVRYSKMFERTAETIVNVHQKLAKFYKESKLYVTCYVDESDETMRKFMGERLNKAGSEFRGYFAENKIYIPKAVANKITSFEDRLYTLEILHKRFLKLESGSSETLENQKKAYDELKDLAMELPQLLTDLEDEFQKLLGFPIEDKQPESKE